MSAKNNHTDSTVDASDQESQTHVVAHGTIEYQGPLPPPGALRAYDEIEPGTAKTMLNEWQKDRQHQRKMQSRFVDVFTNESRWAPAYRILTLVIVIAGGLLAILLGEPAVGWFLGLGAALSYPVGSALFRILRGRDYGSRFDQSNDS